jgi:two-component system chemotaxis sensor kinase CheA
MNEFVEQFLLESRELVEQATVDLLALEENPGDVERLDGAFRAFHTLKGSAGIVDFAAMARATHVAEDALAGLRSGKAAISRDMISNCLTCLDQVVQWLDTMQISGEIPATADKDADAIERRFGDAKSAPVPEHSNPFSSSDLPAAAAALLKAQIELLGEQVEESAAGRLLSAGRVVVNALRSLRRDGEIAPFERVIGEAAAADDARPLIAALEKLLTDNATAPAINAPATALAQDATARVLRVDVEKVDALVKVTGELTVAKNAIGHAAQLARIGTDPAILAQTLKDQHAVMGRLVEELQRSVLGIRVLPLRHVFNRFPKLVREIAENLNKSARLVTEGDDTEADKVVVENLFEPLLHIIRNALDHGIENASVRAETGKPPTATINLRASRGGDVVLVEVADDGRGIDVAMVRRLAVERGVVEAEAMAAMSDEDAIDLVFAPGFSTAETVTDLSGRGVGMDVVRRNVERLGGSARIATRPGHGTTVSLKLPFSVMMTRVMTVEADGQIFGIPLDNVVETVRIRRGQISAVGAARAFVLRDRTIPLIDLSRSLGAAKQASSRPEANIVVVSIGGTIGSVEVDRFGERLDVMLKPMDGLLQGTPGVAGTSLMGDGGVLIVLDLPDLLQ